MTPQLSRLSTVTTKTYTRGKGLGEFAYIRVPLWCGQLGGAFRHEHIEVLYAAGLAGQLFRIQVWRKWQRSLLGCWQGLPY